LICLNPQPSHYFESCISVMSPIWAQFLYKRRGYHILEFHQVTSRSQRPLHQPIGFCVTTQDPRCFRKPWFLSDALQMSRFPSRCQNKFLELGTHDSRGPPASKPKEIKPRCQAQALKNHYSKKYSYYQANRPPQLPEAQTHAHKPLWAGPLLLLEAQHTPLGILEVLTMSKEDWPCPSWREEGEDQVYS